MNKLAELCRRCGVGELSLFGSPVLGEAVRRLSPELQERRPQAPWQQIVAVRHRIVHAYFDWDWQILWNSAVDPIPQLRAQISGILDSEFPQSDLIWRATLA